ncbi:hypothetical protein FOZ62_020519, partial [Perkinsus olseni]
EERSQIAERNGLDQCLEVKYADVPPNTANTTTAPAAAAATRFPGLGVGPGGPSRGGPQMGGGTATSAHYSMAKWKLGMEVMGVPAAQVTSTVQRTLAGLGFVWKALSPWKFKVRPAYSKELYELSVNIYRMHQLR